MCAKPHAPPPPSARPMRVTAGSLHCCRARRASRSTSFVEAIRTRHRALARATVSLGDSPNNARYWPAKRLRCQNPKSDAARVTGSRANGPSSKLASHLAQRGDAEVGGWRHAVAVVERVAYSSFGDSRRRAQIAQHHPLVLHARRVLHARPHDAQAGGAQRRVRARLAAGEPDRVAAVLQRDVDDPQLPFDMVAMGQCRRVARSCRYSPPTPHLRVEPII